MAVPSLCLPGKLALDEFAPVLWVPDSTCLGRGLDRLIAGNEATLFRLFLDWLGLPSTYRSTYLRFSALVTPPSRPYPAWKPQPYGFNSIFFPCKKPHEGNQCKDIVVKLTIG